MFEQQYLKNNLDSDFSITGIDEVGRGPLAGPVVACAVSIISGNRTTISNFLKYLEVLGVTDSKKMSAKKRSDILKNLKLKLIAAKKIEISFEENCKVRFSIVKIKEDEIDKINILNASLLAMKKSFELNQVKHGVILIDGNKKFNHRDSFYSEAIVKGDSKSVLIGFASIIAKEYRDSLMEKYALDYPHYGWNENAGYGTKKHLESIVKYGVTKYHRKSFKGVKEVYEERGLV